MNGIAALAAKEVVAASGLGAGLLPGVAPSAVDGFAAGTLLSGVCFLLIVAPRHGLRRPRLSARGRSLPDPAEAIDITETTAWHASGRARVRGPAGGRVRVRDRS